MDLNSFGLSETDAHDAVRIVDREKRITSEKLTEIDRFERRVRGMDADGMTGGLQGDAGGGVAAVSAEPVSGSVCGDVVEAFEDTLNRCEKDTDLRVTMSGELGKEIAGLVLKDDRSGLTPELKRAVLRSTDERRSQLRVLRQALETEEESVKSTVGLVESVDGAVSADDHLIGLGFDELRRRHRSLTRLRRDCERRIHERQRTLSETTKEASAAGLRHMSLIEYLYEELPTEHPVLSTLTEAVRVCEDEKRELRGHICKVI